MLVRCGVRENLDGIFSVVPGLVASIVEAAEAADWELAATRQEQLTGLLNLVRTKYPLMPACSEILNARGIPGRIFAMPSQRLSPEQRDQLLAEPLVHQLLHRSVSGNGTPRPVGEATSVR